MTHIWVPSAKIIEPKRELMLKNRLVGLFKLEAVRPDGRRRLLADWFPNIITNVGLNRIGTANDYLAACRVGSGSATPTALDTNLQSHVAGTGTIFSSNNAAQGAPPYFVSHTRVYRFAAGVAAGNLQEIGIANATANATGVLFSRALILDGSGNPTTITVLSDEVLDATYQCRLYPPLSDVTETVNISGADYDILIRAANVTDNSVWCMPGLAAAAGNSCRLGDGTIGATIANGPSGPNTLLSCTAAAYGDNTLFRDSSVTAGLGEANFAGGIDWALMAFAAPLGPGANSSLGQLQCSFDPPIPKDNTMTLSLTFRIAWARGSI